VENVTAADVGTVRLLTTDLILCIWSFIL